MSKALKPAWSKIPFVTAAYRSIEHLRQLLSQPAARCPSADDQSRCQLSVHAYSTRLKCPYGRLVRLRCSTHESTFTVYPPGLTPYARRLHLPLDRQGNVIPNTEINARLRFILGSLEHVFGIRLSRLAFVAPYRTLISVIGIRPAEGATWNSLL